MTYFTEIPSVWALSALGVSFLVMAVYLLIFFTFLYVCAWPVTVFIRSIASIIYHD